MKKTVKKPLVFLPILILFVVVSLSANKSMFPSREITNDAKSYCIQFQNLRGSNRIAEFQKVFESLFNNQKEIKSFSFSDIEKTLGKADAIMLNGDWVYYLNPSQESCKVILSADNSVQTIYCTITDCK